MKIPHGYSPIPNSKKGGYRKREGGKYVYWYPDGQTEGGAGDDSEHRGITIYGPEEVHGLKARDIADLSGAPDGATVRISVAGPRRIDVTFTLGFGTKGDRTIELPSGKSAGVITNVSLHIRETGKGIGAGVLKRQVEACQKHGFRMIQTLAAGNAADKEYNGYYTWARLGYDAPFSVATLHEDYGEEFGEEYSPEDEKYIEENARKFRHCKTIQDLMQTPGGAEFWKRVGHQKIMRFDTTPGSNSVKALERYFALKRN